MIYILLLVFSFMFSMFFLSKHGVIAVELQPVKISKNFVDGKYQNTEITTITREGKTFDTIWRWISSDNVREPENKLSFTAEKFSRTPSDESSFRAMWLGHSTLLLEIDGMIFLTDPVWSNRASPFSLMGPSRFFAPPLPLEELPELDGVIISHNHYDHLDSDTIKILAKKGVMFYVPLGVEEYLLSWGVLKEQIKEFDWWDNFDVGKSHKIICTPARHFSGRGLFDGNKSLWSSWVIIGNNHRIFFGGDSGYFPGFKEIGDVYGPFDMTFLEIGAYDENWPEIHLGPQNAIRAQIDVKGKVLFPIHWGTFNLAIHAWTEPAEKTLEIAGDKNLKVTLPRPGQLITGEIPVVLSYWWNKNESKNAFDYFHKMKAVVF